MTSRWASGPWESRPAAGPRSALENRDGFAGRHTCSSQRVTATRLWPKQGPLPTGSGPCAFRPIDEGFFAVSRPAHAAQPRDEVGPLNAREPVEIVSKSLNRVTGSAPVT